MRKQNRFNCMTMKRQAQKQIYEEIKDMTGNERVDYFHRRVLEGPFGDLWKGGRQEEEKRGSSGNRVELE